jgi:hypothetical protein
MQLPKCPNVRSRETGPQQGATVVIAEVMAAPLVSADPPAQPHAGASCDIA